MELLAPARTAEIGFAAIDCGADAVYIAGPAFGARQAAGNSIEDIACLCEYAHRFGVRIFATVNTIVYEQELSQVKELVKQLADAGADALIIQDGAVLEMAKDSGMALHASTQCSIRTPEKARFIESLGYDRLVLERELSLEEICSIRAAVDTEIEFFVHGALCVCYSGECYLSEYLSGRSANRGACIQACRSLYDLEDSDGKLIARNKPLLSLKDYNLLGRLEDLAQAGVCSFKIEGRLKNESYVRNVCKAYSDALDALVLKHPELYRRASFGKITGGVRPNLEKTFNRAYTQLFLDGKRGKWASLEAPKSMGEYIGTLERILPNGIRIAPASPSLRLSNGDGLSFLAPDGTISGFRADVCRGFDIRCKSVEGLVHGQKLYRNISVEFEKEIEASKPVRRIPVELKLLLKDGRISLSALTEDGRSGQVEALAPDSPAQNVERMMESIRAQLSKSSSIYEFKLVDVAVEGPLPFLPLSFLNGMRRDLASLLDEMPPKAIPLGKGKENVAVKAPVSLDYKANVANSVARELYTRRGSDSIEEAYELTHRRGGQLMRSKYCIRCELGLCPREGQSKTAAPLFLINGGKRLRADFHCDVCEMSICAAADSAE